MATKNESAGKRKEPVEKPKRIKMPRLPTPRVATAGVQVGQKFDKLTVTEIEPGSNGLHRMATCKCDCGGTRNVRLNRLLHGFATECVSCVKARKQELKKALDEIRGKTEYFKKLGGLGGKNTLKNNGAIYFRRIAALSHQKRRENAAAKLLEQQDFDHR